MKSSERTGERVSIEGGKDKCENFGIPLQRTKTCNSFYFIISYMIKYRPKKTNYNVKSLLGRITHNVTNYVKVTVHQKVIH